jgi:hypothetical protein
MRAKNITRWASSSDPTFPAQCVHHSYSYVDVPFSNSGVSVPTGTLSEALQRRSNGCEFYGEQEDSDDIWMTLIYRRIGWADGLVLAGRPRAPKQEFSLGSRRDDLTWVSDQKES